jgi:uncharacterized Zn-binding protein involved in type VI secretion
MTKSIQRVGDINNSGAPIISVNQSSVFADNLGISVDGSRVRDHLPGRFGHQHRNVVTSNGSANIFIENKRVNCAGDPDTCGHIRIAGSSNLYMGG